MLGSIVVYSFIEALKSIIFLPNFYYFYFTSSAMIFWLKLNDKMFFKFNAFYGLRFNYILP